MECILSLANSPLNESNEEMRIEQWCLYFHSIFPFLFVFSQGFAIKAELNLELLPFIFGGPK